MNKFEKITLSVALVLTFLTVRGLVTLAGIYGDTRSISGSGWTIWIAGWVIAAYGPLAIAIWFWRWAKRVRTPWVLHLLFLPCAFLPLQAGLSMILFVIDDPDFDSMMGGPVIPAMLFFLVSVGEYFGAVTSRWFRTEPG